MTQTGSAADQSTESANAQKEVLYVGNMRSHDVAVLDISTAKVLRTFDMGNRVIDGRTLGMQPDYFKASPDHRVVYISAYPRSSEVENRSGGALFALDAATDEVLWEVPINGQANHISITKDGRLVYVPVRDKNYVEIVDTEAREVVGRAKCGWGPHGSQLSEDEQHLYVGCMWEDELTVIDTGTRQPIKRIPLGEAVRPFVVTRDEKVAYVELSKLHGFKVIDLERELVSQTVHFPPLPPGNPLPDRWNYTVTHGMKATRAEDRLYTAASAGDFVAVHELPSLRLIDTVPVGREPAYVTLNLDESICFASNRKEETVSFIDTATLKEVERVPIGGTYVSRMMPLRAPESV